MTLKATEIRIGNITNFGRVYEITESCFYVKNSKGESFKSAWADIQPVNLTEEWLLKFGFLAMQFDNEDDWFVKGSGRKVFKISTANGEKECDIWIPLYQSGIGKDFAYLTDIEYVHQIQNLYFNLIGEELECQA